MYCDHCGKKINEKRIEAKSSSLGMCQEPINDETTVSYVCPRCGHLIHSDLSKEDVKSLSRAAHAEIQRGNNFFSSGMGFSSIGMISLIISILFFYLAKKPSAQFQLVTDCAEFYVFVVLLAVAVVLLTVGISEVLIGLLRKRKYFNLLRDINNGTFIQ